MLQKVPIQAALPASGTYQIAWDYCAVYNNFQCFVASLQVAVASRVKITCPGPGFICPDVRTGGSNGTVDQSQVECAALSGQLNVLERDFEPGTYVVVFGCFPGLTAFSTVTTSATLLRNVVTIPGLDGKFNGSWTTSSPFSLQGNSADNARAIYFKFKLDTTANVRAQLTSTKECRLYLTQGSFSTTAMSAGSYSKTFTVNNQTFTQPAVPPKLIAQLKPGTYLLEARGPKYDTATFTLNFSASRFPWINDTDADIHGKWGPGSYMSSHRQGRYAQYYSFSLESRSTVRIKLKSYVKANVYLLKGLEANGAELAWGVRGADNVGGAESTITIPLDPGKYAIEATTDVEDTVGDFTLTFDVLSTDTTTMTSGGASSSNCSANWDGCGAQLCGAQFESCAAQGCSSQATLCGAQLCGAQAGLCAAQGCAAQASIYGADVCGAQAGICAAQGCAAAAQIVGLQVCAAQAAICAAQACAAQATITAVAVCAADAALCFALVCAGNFGCGAAGCAGNAGCAVDLCAGAACGAQGCVGQACGMNFSTGCGADGQLGPCAIDLPYCPIIL